VSLSRRALATRLLVGAALAASFAVAFPEWADDWDGLGFLASIRRFDLASFAPHPPGYPVYVLLLKVAAIVTSAPMGAARVVGVMSGVVTFVAMCSALGRAMRGVVAAASICLVPLVFHAFTGVGSEGPALAFAALAAMGILANDLSPRARILLVGLGVGLGLGVRLSWAPFYLPFILLIDRPLRPRTLLVTLLACLSWAVPLVVLTGPTTLLGLLRTHLTGHMTVWGGTAVTEPARLTFLFRDLFVDAFGGGADVLGFVILVMLVVVTIGAIVTRARGTAPATLALLLAPYLVWVTLGQNLRAQPRHVLPIAVVLAFVLARVALSSVSPRWLVAAVACLVALMVTRTALDAVARATLPPPGAQLLAYLRDHASTEPPGTTAVFAGASGRFLDGTEWQASTHPAATYGDALLAMSRMNSLPRRALLTNEVKGVTDGPVRRLPVATFCRPPRLDRRMPCLELYSGDIEPTPPL